MLLIVTGCATNRYKDITINFPEMPLAGKKVADELDKLCLPDKGQCENINEWFNDIYLFRAKYYIIQKAYINPTIKDHSERTCSPIDSC